MRSFAKLNNVARVTIAASAVVVVAVVGVTLLSPSSSPAATLQPGSPTRCEAVGDRARRSVLVRVPGSIAGWGWEDSQHRDRQEPGGPISLNKSIVGPQGAEAIIYWTSFPDGDYADPCARLLARSVGPSAADLAAAVSRAPGTKLVKGPSNVTLGGQPAKHVVLTVRKNVGCDPGFFYSWRDVRRCVVADDERGRHDPGLDRQRGRNAPLHRSRDNLAANSRLNKEIKQIVESIRFG